MSNKNEQNNIPEEIDLGTLFQKTNNFFSNIFFKFFKGILFFKQNIIKIIALIILGIGIGVLLDFYNKSYKSEIIVFPNNDCTDYLYSKLDLFNSKLEEEDAEFFKVIGINNYQSISKIKVEPIVDIYNFVNNSSVPLANAQTTQNFELVKLLSESSDINNVIKDKITSKNYQYHSIQIETKGQISEKNVIKPLLIWLNKDEYLSKVSEITKANILNKMDKNEQEIKQIDSLISQISNSISKNQRSSNLVYNNENNQINGLFDLKNSLINEIAAQKISLLKIGSFIKETSIIVNIKNNKGINGKMKLIIPILFIFSFLFIRILMAFYKSQLQKLKQN
jgi:hypothetical protein